MKEVLYMTDKLVDKAIKEVGRYLYSKHLTETKELIIDDLEQLERSAKEICKEAAELSCIDYEVLWKKGEQQFRELKELWELI